HRERQRSQHLRRELRSFSHLHSSPPRAIVLPHRPFVGIVDEPVARTYPSRMRRVGVCLPVILVSLVACTSSTPETQPTTPPVSSHPSASPTGTPESTPRWTPIATAPISGRTFAGVVWTGSEMLVWGGVHHSASGGQQESDGAAYDPATDSWEKLAPAPAGMQGGGGRASAWDGSEASFWVGNSPDGPVGTATYDPVAGSWHRLPPG